jgi:hypothetical protein
VSIYCIKLHLDKYLPLRSQLSLYRALYGDTVDFLSSCAFHEYRSKIIEYYKSTNQRFVSQIQTWSSRWRQDYIASYLLIELPDDLPLLVDCEIRPNVQRKYFRGTCNKRNCCDVLNGTTDLLNDIKCVNSFESYGRDKLFQSFMNRYTLTRLYNCFPIICIQDHTHALQFDTLTLRYAPAGKIFAAIKRANVLRNWFVDTEKMRRSYQWLPYAALFKNLSRDEYLHLVDEVERYARYTWIMKQAEDAGTLAKLLCDIGDTYKTTTSSKRCFSFSLCLPSDWERFENSQGGLCLSRYDFSYFDYNPFGCPKYDNRYSTLFCNFTNSSCVYIPCRLLNVHKFRRVCKDRSFKRYTFTDWMHINYYAKKEFKSTQCFEYKLNCIGERHFDCLARSEVNLNILRDDIFIHEH